MRRNLSGRTLCRLLGLASGFVLFVTAHTATMHAASPQQTDTATPHRALLDKYCVSCHNARIKAGDLLLDQADVDDAAAHPDVWERVIRKLSTGAMPPRGIL